MAIFNYTVTAAADNSAYLIDGVANPPLDLQSGNTYVFNVQAPNHPFWIKTDRILGEGSAYDFQVTGNGATQGNVTITLPLGPVPKLFYQCAHHLAMGASLTNIQHIDQSIQYALGDQLPGFVSAEYPMFQRFLEAYYEWLAQPGNPDYTIQKLLDNQDVDTSVDLYLEHLEKEFLAQIPKDIEIDKRELIKNIRSFYASKGTEKSYEFLFNILFNEQVEFYYPKNDILRASDGKWSTVTSIRLLNDNNADVFAMIGKQITQDYIFVDPNTNIPETRTWATAIVERIIQFYLGDTLITEAYLSNLQGLGDFNYSTSDELADRQYVYYKDELNNPIEFRIVPIVSTITVDNRGTGYNAGTILQIDTAPGDSGVGAVGQITSIFPGEINAVDIVNSGQNYQINDIVNFEKTAEIGGSGAAAYVSDVSTDGMPHADGSTGDLDYRGTGVPGNAILYNKSNDILNDTPITREFFFTVHGPGTLTFNALLTNLSDGDYGGDVNIDYFRVYVEDSLAEVEASTTPAVSMVDVSIFENLQHTLVGDKFVRVEFSYSISGATYDEGLGETAEVNMSTDFAFNADGSILEIKMANFGSGYRRVPTGTVISATGTGASIRPRGDNIGRIKEVKILNQNFGALYYDTPTIDMSNYGNGDAVVTLGIGSVARHPGTFRNDDGQLSEAKYLQDNKYYQTFSYVLRTGLSIENYRDTIKKLVHPSGMELFGEVFITNNLRAGLYNNFTSDPNDLIVSERLGGLQIPKFKKTVMLFKTDFVETVTYGGGIKAGQLYQRPRIIDKFINVDGEEIPTTQTKTFILDAPNLGVDPTDIEVFSFPVLKFPIQTDIQNIIIDNQVQVTKVLTQTFWEETNVEVEVQRGYYSPVIQKELDLTSNATSYFSPEISLYAPQTETDVTSHYEREVLVGVGEIRDLPDPLLISEADALYATIKDWGRDLSLHVRIDSRLVDKYSTQVIKLILDYADNTVTTFRTIERTVELPIQTLNDVYTLYQKEINILTDATIEVSNFRKHLIQSDMDLTVNMYREIHRQSQTHTFLLTSPNSVIVTPEFVEQKSTELQILIDSVALNIEDTFTHNVRQITLPIDRTVSVQREIHRHWTTHNYMLTSPREVEVIARPVEEKTNELTITVGLKEIRDYSDVLIGTLDGNAAIRSLDPTTLTVIPRDFIYRNIPVEKIVKELNVTMVAVGVTTEEQRIQFVKTSNIDVQATVSRQTTRLTSNSDAYSVQMSDSIDRSSVVGRNLFNGFIYLIEDRTVGSFDPDNTSIRNIANSQLVSTSLTGYLRDADDNIVGTL